MPQRRVLDASELSEAMMSALAAEGRVRRVRVADGGEVVIVPGDIWATIASELEDILDEHDPELAGEVDRARRGPHDDYERVREGLGLAR